MTEMEELKIVQKLRQKEKLYIQMKMELVNQ